ncbi:uncharacterized protein LOC105162990 isoform X1 [Sesamum indicum]|uniref:Uncharacterized protein LOC105162990 isoform X1 n=1 Tax=Sesamum indicum TaxID=4182 RepID=A0A6I9T619_SESIN|nr:uncharacterized protein LOC105162990 isoform X1 [Sesamum indicum]
MRSDEAKILLGFPPNSIPSPTQIKAAYRRKAWQTHPDRFPPHLKPEAESKFKLISEAYSFFTNTGGNGRIQPTGISFWFSNGNHQTRITIMLIDPSPITSIIFSGCENWSSKSTPWTKKHETCFCSFPCHNFGSTYAWWINCFQGLSKTKGGSTFLQSFSPVSSHTMQFNSVQIYKYNVIQLYAT